MSLLSVRVATFFTPFQLLALGELFAFTNGSELLVLSKLDDDTGRDLTGAHAGQVVITGFRGVGVKRVRLADTGDRAWWGRPQDQAAVDFNDALDQIGYMREDWATLARTLGFETFTDPEEIIRRAGEHRARAACEEQLPGSTRPLDRTPATPRRIAAVERLLAAGYTWEDGRWEAPVGWIERAAYLASQYVVKELRGVKPERNDMGLGTGHLRWMAEELLYKRVGSETKVCRWLGYLQAGLVHLDLSSLEVEKARNLASKPVVESMRNLKRLISNPKIVVKAAAAAADARRPRPGKGTP